MKRLLAAISFALILVSPAVAAGEESILRFHDQVSISQNGDTAVTETILYNFGTTTHHGITRSIPTRYQDSNGNKYYTDFTLVSVTDDSFVAIPATQSQQGDGVELKIGDTHTTVTGQHTYIVTYKLSSIIRPGNGIDRFAFNVTGNSTLVSTAEASATVTLDGLTVVPSATRCFTGIAGSTSSNCTAGLDGKFVTNASLNAAEGLSIELDYPKGTFSQYVHTGAPPTPAWQLWLIYAVGAYIVFLTLLLLWPLVGVYRTHREKKAQTVVAQYEAPDGLKPGELGMVADSTVSMSEITATLLDLAVRGYMKITQLKAKSLFGAAEYRFDKLREGTDLADYEAQLFNTIFVATPSVELKNLDRTALSVAVTAVKKQIQARLESLGYFQQQPINWVYMIMLILLALPLLFVAPPVAIIIIVLAFTLASIARISDTGIAEWAKVQGFKLFLTVTEADRLKSSDAPNKTPELFNKLLPAAVALGVEKEWASQFGNMDLGQSTSGWYTGANGSSFTPVLFASSLSSDFGSAVSSGFAPVSSGRGGVGGGGGGGFSGGGFGGGGTGSW